MSWSHAQLPAYVKRDLRRLVGQYQDVNPCHEINVMRLAIEAILSHGEAAMVEGWGVRRAGGNSSVRKAAEAICHGKPWALFYSRRGDLCFFHLKAS